MKQKMWEKIFHRYDPPAWEQGETRNSELFNYENKEGEVIDKNGIGVR